MVVRVYSKDVGMIFRHSSSASRMRAKWMLFGSSVPTKQTMLVSPRGNKAERSAQRHGRRRQRTSTTRQATAFAQVLKGAAHVGDGGHCVGKETFLASGWRLPLAGNGPTVT